MIQPARPIASAHLLNKEGILSATNKRALRWARRFHRIASLPGCLGEVFVCGAESLALHPEKTPVLAFSHKKMHDVLLAVEFLLCREFPMPRHTVIAQGGLFSGMYVYRDWIPAFMKAALLRPSSIAVSKWMGAALARFFRDMDCHPVYRRFRDVPSQKVYNSPVFAGKAISGFEYEEFMKFTRAETEHSISTVSRHILQENRQLIVFPEGKYQHSGEISRLNRFLMQIAGDSGHPVMTVSFAYDELCPDRLGRIDAWFCPVLVPADKRAALTASVAESLQRNTVILASHLIAVILLSRARHTPDAFAEHMQTLAERARQAGHRIDTRLCTLDFNRERLHRFLKRRNLSGLNKGVIEIRPHELRKFARSERTVNDLAWNRNNIKHAWRDLGVADD